MRILFIILFAVLLSAQLPRPTQTRLSLSQAVETALKNNLEIEIEKTNQAAAHIALRGARGFMDPAIRFQPLGESRNTPTGSSLASSTGTVSENLFSQNFYYRQRLPWQGLIGQASFENIRQSTNNPFTSLNPYLQPRLTIGLTLPLLRDRKIDADRANLIIRRKQTEVSDTDFELKVIDVVARVEQSYYDLAAVRADLQVVDEAVKLAQEQLDRTKRMIESGSMAPVELSAAEAELERRRDTFFQTLTQLTQVENALKTLLASGRDQDLWKDEIIPTTDQRSAPPPALELPGLVAEALKKRSEFRALAHQKDMNAVQRDLAGNQRQVQANVTGAYISSGLAGTVTSTESPFTALTGSLVQRLNQISIASGLAPLPPINLGGGVPPGFVGGVGQSLSNLFSGRYQSFQGGLTLDWTPRNTAAEAALAQTAVTERRIGLLRRQLEQAIEAQVRNALQSIVTSEQRMAAAEASARAAREKLASETRLFQTGESTNFLVLTRQNELSDSRRRVVVATLEFNKSVARLGLALGKKLEEYAIDLK
ncbi:MAG TPA: TolC family protein [Bryobacteraceae bacterium]|nr:TolC family protein [Bryobacteraceae bacterium]